MKKQKAIVNCENVKLCCLPKWHINCIIQSNKDCVAHLYAVIGNGIR